MSNDTPPTGSPEEMQAKIEDIHVQIKKRLDAYEKIDEALKDEHWEAAYTIARDNGIDIYDPFSTFREASDAIRKAGDSVRAVSTEKNKIRLYEEIWEKLERWNISLVDLQEEKIRNYAKFDNNKDLFNKIMTKAPDGQCFLIDNEYQKILTWLRLLRRETHDLNKIQDFSKMTDIKKNIVVGNELSSDDFKWLYKQRQQIPNSRIVNRLYVKAEQRFLNQSELDAGKDYQQDFKTVEQAFRTSNQNEFCKGISDLETKLTNEKNPILLKIYQSAVYIWRQRLLAWECALMLVQEFKARVSQDDSESFAEAWSDGKDLSLFFAALLDLRDIPPEIFALKVDEDSGAVGETLKKTLQEIAQKLEEQNDTTLKTGAGEELAMNHTAKSEWLIYLKEVMPSWIDEQLQKGKALWPEDGMLPSL